MKVHLGSHKKKRLITEINMVPFIDVVLVLLIIFMIVSPFIAQSQVPVNLPRAAGQPGDNDNPLRVKITRDGDYYIGDQRVLRNNFGKSLDQALSQNERRAVLIEADRDVSFKNVILALDAAQKIKGAKVGVAVLPTEEAPDEANTP
ncbi:MAG: biopolymer transporter ExbD [Elusimicrobia bacterium]|jgi:biopolymer transport protein ExbD|nr:biopolymer transporter ExbD [Elusimicrobiota bacterium]